MECRSLGENKSNYNTVSSVRQIRQQGTDYKSKKSKSSGGGQVIAGLAVGAAAGVIAGMLLAPEKGESMRKKVSEQASKLGDQVNKGYSSTRGKVNDWTSKMKGSKTDAHVNQAPNLQGEKQKSPYTDTNKWDAQEDRNMTNTARNTPGV
ncbi:hypothetical protein CA264_13205 [Pontibacter actiniarum]|uniref:YtxH domain-containing protein n=2 Tax=Pontibacter actiniarum TaxID=323450 RepID=A0A1X9YTV6_9BACT|nr:hypothetical protein CA264_13205 [Pontibacter actiniarum]